ncbi:hypothetical protein [Lentzea sp. NBRC 102530]|uniref:hypothetical protein n=1 Tax=Lentzea sp. NBRC 102530 TaxID=3032201 RepID=UPI0024A01F35|nr:hypothetical protein [Lentzea sp. NBRC 102530]GLY49292.1 hypothetical protein Lesp01_29480 [Lentzea sp. NBRC 102530]
MIRRTTAVALVLSAVPAALALAFTGTAQATDTPWQHRGGNDTPWVQRHANDTPWGAIDTPWNHSVKLPKPQGDDTPWS